MRRFFREAVEVSKASAPFGWAENNHRVAKRDRREAESAALQRAEKRGFARRTANARAPQRSTRNRLPCTLDFGAVLCDGLFGDPLVAATSGGASGA